jgi:hypothetical protein
VKTSNLTKWHEVAENCTVRGFITWTLRQLKTMIKSRRMTRAGHVARIGKNRDAYSLMEKIPLGKLRRRWVDNIETNLGEAGYGATG